uniref:Superoxide dismutase [Cu-Zn] n=1 Tax=Biomphalaria glabrata TaxID=6526 RepID=A0A182YTM0_BIOGL
MTIHLSGF